MEATPALQELLEELSTVTHDERVPVRLAFGQGSHADIDGEYVQVDPSLGDKVDAEVSGPNDLRLVVDTHSHEMEHIRTSDLEGKKNFAEEYPECPSAAGHVHNILEDQWVDQKRCDRYPGHKRSRALKAKLCMGDDEITPPVDTFDGAGKYIEGLKQLAFGGYVKGLDAASDELAAFLNEVDPHIEAVRTEPDPDARDEIAHDVMDALLDHVADEYGGTGAIEDHDPHVDGARIIKIAADDLEIEAGDADDPRVGGPVVILKRTDHGGDVIEPEWPDDEADADDADADCDGDGDGDAGGSEAGGDAGSDPGDDAADADDAAGGAGGDGDDGVSGSGGGDTPEPAGGHGGGQDADDPEKSRVEDRDETEIESRYGVDDPTATTEMDERRYERYERKREAFDTDLAQKKRERDERIEHDYVPHPKDTVRTKARELGVISETEQRFREYVTREQPRPSETGQRLDTRNVVRRAAGDYGTDELFEYQRPVETGGRCVAVALDISGSMDVRMLEAKIAIAAIAKATEIIGDTFIGTCFTDTDHAYKKAMGEDIDRDDALDLRVVTGPNESFEWDHLDSFTHERNEPTAAAMRFTKELMDDVDANDNLLVVITDGETYVTEDGRRLDTTDEPVEDCKNAAADIRADGVSVVGVGIGGMDEPKMERAFGDEHNVLTTVEDLPADLMELYEKQLDSRAVRRR